MESNNLIIKSNIEQPSERIIKSKTISYCNVTGAQRTVSQTFVQPSGKPPSKFRKIIRDISYTLPKIKLPLTNEETDGHKSNNSEILLVNGRWDISDKIPSIVAEMHNVNNEDLKTIHQNNETYEQQTIFQQGSECQDFMIPSSRGSDSGIESDCQDGNLSWLLNYKIQELPPVPDEKTDSISEIRVVSVDNFSPQLNHDEDFAKQFNNSFSNNRGAEPLQVHHSTSSKEDSRGSGAQSYRYSGPKKPPFTYTELIEHALCEKGELTVSGIYNWISDHFPFYKQNDDRWKNSVRHNLSINPHFRKGDKAVRGAGHLWTIAQRDNKKSLQIKHRMQQFIQTNYKDNRTSEQEAFDRELQAATASILGEVYSGENENICVDIIQNDNLKSEDIQVEYVNVIDVTNGLGDFLAPPVSKQQLVQECGLGSDFLITDLNPNTLGVNMAEAEVIASSDVLYDDISFPYYELQKE